MNIKQVGAVALATGMISVLGACGTTGNAPVTSHGALDGDTSQPAKKVEKPKPQGLEVTKDNLTLNVKTLTEECFGSGMGCSVTWRVNPDFSGPEGDLKDDYEVTFKMTGVDGDEPISTILLNKNRTYDAYMAEGYSDTAAKGAELKPVIIQIEKMGL